MLKKHLHSLTLIATLTVCYAVTIAPGLTWANGGADGGDLITAAATGGIAHPSGYPLYLLLARAFQLLPIGTLAFRTNLFSAVCTGLAALALQTFLRRQQISSGIALIAGLAFGLAPAIWSQAVISEVYGLQSLLLILFVWEMLEENLPGGEWMRGLLFGLTLSNHLTALLLFPLLLLRAAPQLGLARPGDLFRRGLGCAAGLSLYLTLWIRAVWLQAPVNWGNPVTLENFWWLVSGRLYASYPFDISLAEAGLRLRTVGGLLLEQFTIPGVLLGIYGLFSGLPRRTLLATLWIFVCFAGFATFYGSYDSQVYLIPAYLVFVIWVAYGIQDIPQKLAKPAVTLIILGLLVRAPFSIPTVNANTPQAEQFGAQYIAKAPQNAIIFASGDEAVFALWYFHYAVHQRPDTVVIAEALLPYGWYAENLAHTYPSLRLSVTGTSRYEIIGQNPGRFVCYVSSKNLNQAEFCNASP